MTAACQLSNRRILVIDDNEAIHADFQKIMGKSIVKEDDLWEKASLLFGETSQPDTVDGFDIDSAHQGQEGWAMVKEAMACGLRYSLAFVDVRMPPGWDGIETVRHIWEVDPDILVVICTAYSDRTWEDMVRELRRRDRFLVLKKPFDTVEVRQLALALTERWKLARDAEIELNKVVQLVDERTQDLKLQSAEIEQSSRELEFLRTQLANARRQLEVAESAKTDFLATLSQGIGPPTEAICQFAELLRADGDLSKAPLSRLRSINAILDNAQKLLARVKSLS